MGALDTFKAKYQLLRSKGADKKTAVQAIREEHPDIMNAASFDPDAFGQAIVDVESSISNPPRPLTGSGNLAQSGSLDLIGQYTPMLPSTQQGLVEGAAAAGGYVLGGPIGGGIGQGLARVAATEPPAETWTDTAKQFGTGMLEGTLFGMVPPAIRSKILPSVAAKLGIQAPWLLRAIPEVTGGAVAGSVSGLANELAGQGEGTIRGPVAGGATGSFGGVLSTILGQLLGKSVARATEVPMPKDPAVAQAMKTLGVDNYQALRVAMGDDYANSWLRLFAENSPASGQMMEEALTKIKSDLTRRLQASMPEIKPAAEALPEAVKMTEDLRAQNIRQGLETQLEPDPLGSPRLTPAGGPITTAETALMAPQPPARPAIPGQPDPALARMIGEDARNAVIPVLQKQRTDASTAWKMGMASVLGKANPTQTINAAGINKIKGAILNARAYLNQPLEAMAAGKARGAGVPAQVLDGLFEDINGLLVAREPIRISDEVEVILKRLTKLREDFSDPTVRRALMGIEEAVMDAAGDSIGDSTARDTLRGVKDAYRVAIQRREELASQFGVHPFYLKPEEGVFGEQIGLDMFGGVKSATSRITPREVLGQGQFNVSAADHAMAMNDVAQAMAEKGSNITGDDLATIMSQAAQDTRIQNRDQFAAYAEWLNKTNQTAKGARMIDEALDVMTNPDFPALAGSQRARREALDRAYEVIGNAPADVQQRVGMIGAWNALKKINGELLQDMFRPKARVPLGAAMVERIRDVPGFTLLDADSRAGFEALVSGNADLYVRKIQPIIKLLNSIESAGDPAGLGEVMGKTLSTARPQVVRDLFDTIKFQQGQTDLSNRLADQMLASRMYDKTGQLDAIGFAQSLVNKANTFSPENFKTLVENSTAGQNPKARDFMMSLAEILGPLAKFEGDFKASQQTALGAFRTYASTLKTLMFAVGSAIGYSASGVSAGAATLPVLYGAMKAPSAITRAILSQPQQTAAIVREGVQGLMRNFLQKAVAEGVLKVKSPEEVLE